MTMLHPSLRRLSPLSLLALAPLLSGPSCSGGSPGYTPPGTPTPPETPPGDDGSGDDSGGEDAALLLHWEFPPTASCTSTTMATVIMRNIGASTWTRADGFKLGTVDDEDPLFGPDTRVWLPEGVAVEPGQDYAFDIPLRGSESGSFTTDWRMVHEGVRWFGDVAVGEVEVACGGSTTPPPVGLVRLDGTTFVDDNGPFVGMGASLFWAAWGYRHDRARLEQNLQFLSNHGYDSIRALGVVGDPDRADYWDGREIDDAWPDYGDVIAGLTDLAYDTYGLRVQWTLIGDGQVSVPSSAERYALADRFLAMSEGREHKILLFEVANEAWQNGFGGDAGVDELRAMTRYLQDRTDILVAASAPDGHECADTQRIYGGGVGDVATIHFDRQISLADGPWRPVRQPWEHAYCPDVPPGLNNEPIGPGASVNSENDPERLVAAAVVTWISGLPNYVFHSRAGVRGDEDIWNMAGAAEMQTAPDLVPPNLPNWSRRNAHWADSPFRPFAEDGSGSHPDAMWPDMSGPTAGAVRAYGSVSGNDFLVFPIGILNHVRLEARRAMTWQLTDPMTGGFLDAGNLAAGESITLDGAGALLVTGRFTD